MTMVPTILRPELTKYWSIPVLGLLQNALNDLDRKCNVIVTNLGPDYKEYPALNLSKLRSKHRKFLRKYIEDRIFYIKSEMMRVSNTGAYMMSLPPEDVDRKYIEEVLTPMTDLHSSLTELSYPHQIIERVSLFNRLVYNRIRLFKMMAGEPHFGVANCMGMDTLYKGKLLTLVETFVRGPGSDVIIDYLITESHHIFLPNYRMMVEEFGRSCRAYRNALISPETSGLRVQSERSLPMPVQRLWDNEAPESSKQLFMRMIRDYDRLAAKQGFNMYDIVIALLEYQTLSPVALSA